MPSMPIWHRKASVETPETQWYTCTSTQLAQTTGSGADATSARNATCATWISNQPTIHQEQPGVPTGPESSDGTSYPLTVFQMRSVALNN